MASSLSNLVGDLAEGIYKIKCKKYDCFLENKIFNESNKLQMLIL